MAIGALFLLEVMILISFIIITIFLFLPKNNETVHKIFFALAVMLGLFVTMIDATALPSNMRMQIIVAWLFLIPEAIAILVSIVKGKPNVISKLLVLSTSVLGALGYLFIF